MRLKTLIQAGAAGTLAFVALAGAQLYSTAKATDQALETAIQTWSETNPDGGNAITRYKEFCTSSGPAKMPPAPTPFITLAECTAQIGDDSLAKVILEAADSVEAPAPLRWF